MEKKGSTDGSRANRRAISRWILFIVSGLAIGLIFSYILITEENKKNSQTDRTVPTVGKPLSETSLVGTEGEAVSLRDYLGRPVVINFWGTWCAHCIEEMAMFEDYHQQYSDDFIMLGINSLDSLEVIEDFVGKNNITFTIITDFDGEITEFYYIRGFPSTFFLDDKGILQARHVGSINEKQMQKYLDLIGVDIKK